MSKTRVAPARPTPKALTLADVTITWKDDTGHERRLPGRDLAALIRRQLFFAQNASEPPLWQCRLRGLSALMFPEAGISIYEEDGRALVADLLADAAAGVAAEQMDLGKLAAGFTISRKGARS